MFRGVLLGFISLLYFQAKSLSFVTYASLYPRTTTEDGLHSVYFSPCDMPIHAIKPLLEGAKKSITIYTYIMDVEEYGSILEDALKNNPELTIKFGVDYDLSFDENTVWNSLKTSPRLKKFRLPVLRGKNPRMHNKVIIIDEGTPNQKVITGSPNFSYSGLAGNYENIHILTEPHIVQSFVDEFEELSAISKAVYDGFSPAPELWDTGEATLEPAMDQYLRTGSFPISALHVDKGSCLELAEARGLLKSRNLPNDFISPTGAKLYASRLNFQIAECFKDPTGKEPFDERYDTLIRKIAEIEKYVDGTSVTRSKPKRTKTIEAIKTNGSRVLFSPEDNIEHEYIELLNLTLKDPTNSFVYLSVNFITNTEITRKLVELHKAGVKIRAFFDRGRMDDSNFGSQLESLSKLGITTRVQSEKDAQKSITKFDNQRIGTYGSNHNKFGVIGIRDPNDPNLTKLILFNGSANLSNDAMHANDENTIISTHPQVCAIFLKEMLSQMLIYRYGGDFDGEHFQKELRYLTDRVPLLKDLLGMGEKLSSWNPYVKSSISISIDPVTFDPKKDRVWVWVVGMTDDSIPNSKVDNGIALPAFTGDSFSNKFVTQIPAIPGSKIRFRIFKAPKDEDPNLLGINNLSWIEWEKNGTKNGTENGTKNGTENGTDIDRIVETPPIGLSALGGNYTFGEGDFGTTETETYKGPSPAQIYREKTKIGY